MSSVQPLIDVAGRRRSPAAGAALIVRTSSEAAAALSLRSTWESGSLPSGRCDHRGGVAGTTARCDVDRDAGEVRPAPERLLASANGCAAPGPSGVACAREGGKALRASSPALPGMQGALAAPLAPCSCEPGDSAALLAPLATVSGAVSAPPALRGRSSDRGVSIW